VGFGDQRVGALIAERPLDHFQIDGASPLAQAAEDGAVTQF
jgi:hypothetical protein